MSGIGLNITRMSSLDSGMLEALATLPPGEYQKVREFTANLIEIIKNERDAKSVGVRKIAFLEKRVKSDEEILIDKCALNRLLIGTWVGAFNSIS